MLLQEWWSTGGDKFFNGVLVAPDGHEDDGVLLDADDEYVGDDVEDPTESVEVRIFILIVLCFILQLPRVGMGNHGETC